MKEVAVNAPTHVFSKVAFLLLTAFLSGSLRLFWMKF